MTVPHTAPLRLEIVSDIICPWCFIGKRSLDLALPILAGQGISVEIEWLPYQLNPTVPSEGMDRKAFRTARFGSWENALAMDARAVEAGRPVGADFHYERQNRTPNTMAAHSLARLAQIEGGPVLQTHVVDALFVAYFTKGEDIGNPAVLDRIADEAGMLTSATKRSADLHDDVRQLDEKMRASRLNGVPSYLIDGKMLFSGSQTVDGYVQRVASTVRSAD